MGIAFWRPAAVSSPERSLPPFAPGEVPLYPSRGPFQRSAGRSRRRCAPPSARHSTRAGRPIAVYPETKNPTWNNAQARANGCPGERPFEDAVLRVIEANGLNAADAPILVQSFEPGSLRYLAARGLKARRVQLIGASGVDYRTGAMLYEGVTEGHPYDWVVAGDPRRFDAMLTPDGLAEIRTYADGIGPDKSLVVPSDGEGLLPATSLVKDAQAAGLVVHPWTVRAENYFLPKALQRGTDPAGHGDVEAVYRALFAAGVDGLFSDFPGLAAKARV